MRWSQRLLSVAFITTGILHFLRTETYESIMPGYLPAHRELVLVSGVAEIAGGLGMAFAGTRRAAGVWLIALLLLVFPANVNMALHSERLPVDRAVAAVGAPAAAGPADLVGFRASRERRGTFTAP